MIWRRLFKKNPRLGKDGDFFDQMKQILGFEPGNIALYHQAFSHSSYVRGKKNQDHNERMEFLGDAILDAVISDYLYREYPDGDEGFLTQNRSKIVSRKTLNRLGSELKLEPLIRENLDQSQRSRYLLGNVMEALIGAIFLDRGYNEADRFIREKMIAVLVDQEDLEDLVLSYRSVIHEWAQQTRAELEFELEEAGGPSHDRTFRSRLLIDGEFVGEGEGSSKKTAKENAAKAAIGNLNIKIQ